MDRDQKHFIDRLESMLEEFKVHKDMERAHLAKLMRTELVPISNEIASLGEMVLNLNFVERISFSLQEAAKATGFSYATLYNKVKTGKLPASQDCGKGKIIVLKEDVVKLIIANKLPSCE